ncbi:unnamed protein product [Periconia digitata]|uniref:Arabinan endo-1,5-alpha-L-arabinosidase n=1 Tax=Periconia digitata TaxID=1303443 RepID=A0A9W4XFI5_9PLEO|nr:unnamed protein product [Periconia digitata]
MPGPSLFAGLISLVAIARRAELWPNPEPCLGNCTFIHDPSVVRRSDGTWFRISTNGNIAIATAPELIGPWEYQGAMLPDGSKIDVMENQELWAPDVFHEKDEFYAYYSVSRMGSQDSDIGVATSKDAMPGTWTDHGSIGLPKRDETLNYNRIDANFFKECKDCEPIMNYGSAWNDVYQTNLKKDYLSWGGTTPQQKVYNSTFSVGQTFASITEGAFLFWWKVGDKKYYYMFFSSGACCNSADQLAAPGEEYKIMVCRSETVNGRYVDADGKDCLTENGGTLVLGSHGDVYAPGGQGVIVNPDNNKIALYYHYVNTTIGYNYEDFLFGFNYIDLSSGWPVVTAA